ncbi:MAG: MauE/DoxX family redox-associated membrane protein, partial [Planctomycetota bacterium]
MQRGTMYDIVRIVLASVLLLAAGLKGYQLAMEPTLNTTVLDAPWFLIAVVEFELLFRLWLLGNVWASRTCHVAVLCFTVFAAVSLYKALSGAASCGCFGRVVVNPWCTNALQSPVRTYCAARGQLAGCQCPWNTFSGAR